MFDLDFNEIRNNPDFKEDSVRELIIMPILKKLHWTDDAIIRSHNLQHPYLKIGSKKRNITLVPDYLLKLLQSYVCVIDAKAPNEKIIDSDNVEQVYSYATHPEVRSNFFCLCNGIEFVIYRTMEDSKPILYFKMEDIEENFEKMEKLISPGAFNNYENTNSNVFFIVKDSKKDFDYNKRPILKEIPIKKQEASRHYGVHEYFTRQSWNVVAQYIKNFTQKGDMVLDSFGGTGVTAIEAMMNERKAINIDLNPFAVFLVDALTIPINKKEITFAFEEVVDEYNKNEPKSKKEIKELLNSNKYPYPKGIKLPKGSDVEFVEELFSEEQLVKLALLKSIIKKQKDKNIKKVLMLMFSGLVSRANLTCDTRSGAVFKYYRYRVSSSPAPRNIIKYYATRFEKVMKAKEEMSYYINKNTIKNLQNYKGDATDLKNVEDESIDYIYTDPPYGKKIAYLDLSTMFNAWLDLEVTESDYKKEIIEGGELNKTKNDYKKLIAESIKEMYRVLKFDRWLSFVFAHKDPEFWHLITETAENYGFEYVSAVQQKNGHKSFKKNQNPFTVLSGELILNFKKVRNPKAIMKANLGMNITEIIIQTIEGVIAKNGTASIEEINTELVIKGVELGFLDLLGKQYQDITPILDENFERDEQTKRYFIKPNAKFKSHIPLQSRIHYYLLSYLRRAERENFSATFDNIILEIIPLLKNGITPEEQTILTVLEKIAYKTSSGNWKLKEEDRQGSLF